MNLDAVDCVIQVVKIEILVTCLAVSAAFNCYCSETADAAANTPVDLGTVVVESSALSKYRPETVSSGTFTDMPPEKLPCVVDTLTEDFIREHNPTDLNDLLRHVPGIETDPVNVKPYGSTVNVPAPGSVTSSEQSAPIRTRSPFCTAATAAASESYANRLPPLSIAAFFPPSMYRTCARA